MGFKPSNKADNRGRFCRAGFVKVYFQHKFERVLIQLGDSNLPRIQQKPVEPKTCSHTAFLEQHRYLKLRINFQLSVRISTFASLSLAWYETNGLISQFPSSENILRTWGTDLLKSDFLTIKDTIKCPTSPPRLAKQFGFPSSRVDGVSTRQPRPTWHIHMIDPSHHQFPVLVDHHIATKFPNTLITQPYLGMSTLYGDYDNYEHGSSVTRLAKKLIPIEDIDSDRILSDPHANPVSASKSLLHLINKLADTDLCCSLVEPLNHRGFLLALTSVNLPRFD
ncbi:hypothetical protein VNO77_03770 [Canavalia gladiata]|uniref:Uncharacterized protein n=1 Tax=Canavalia gladiata TaxID=3824 RepID=A0AAN9MW56_CANGL